MAEHTQDATGGVVKLLQEIKAEATTANDVIRLNRDGQGQGRIRVATAMHRIADLAERSLRAALTQASPPPELVSALRQSSVDLEEAANIMAGQGLGGCETIFRAASDRARAAIARATGQTARPPSFPPTRISP